MEMKTDSWKVSVHLSLLPFYKYLVLSLKIFLGKVHLVYHSSSNSSPDQQSICISTRSVCWVFLISPSLVLGQNSNSASTSAWKFWSSPSTVDHGTSVSLNFVNPRHKLSGSHVDTNSTDELTGRAGIVVLVCDSFFYIFLVLHYIWTWASFIQVVTKLKCLVKLLFERDNRCFSRM